MRGVYLGIVVMLVLIACKREPIKPEGQRMAVGTWYEHRYFSSVLVRLVREPETGLCFVIAVGYTSPASVAITPAVPCPAETSEGAR